jgi:hypothetical protein
MDEYTQARNALNDASEALNALVYGPGFNYLTEEQQTAVQGALDALADNGAAVEPQAAPVEFTEERPGVWKTATPADGAKLDSLIDDALGKFGTSLEELRAATAEERDETFAVCTACGRTRPHWTMASRTVDGSQRFECSPKFALHCADCCKPGEYLTHYTYEEHEGHTLS